MSAAVLLGALVGVGAVGAYRGVRSRPVPLVEILGSMQRTPRAAPSQTEPFVSPGRVGRFVLEGLVVEERLGASRARALAAALSVTDESLEQVTARAVLAAGAGVVLPPLLWIVLDAMGVVAPLLAPAVLVAVAVPCGTVLPFASLFGQARRRRAHVRVVVGSFVDLVVLALAGGEGVESALFTASQVSPDWAAQRIARVLIGAREGGVAPWTALTRLGDEIGVPELVELAATLQLAGTEGSKVRQALSARAVSLRRHEQADAEAAANTTTERLFVPGALLLVGFLVFIGYPAFARILGGF